MEDFRGSSCSGDHHAGKSCNRGHWRPAEDEKLRQLVDQFGPQNWNFIAEHLQGRSGKSCRLRWYNQLDPNINKMPFTEEEEERLLKAHEIQGNRWASIARIFPGRTDNAVKNHYHVVMARKKRERISTSLQYGIKRSSSSLISTNYNNTNFERLRNSTSSSFRPPPSGFHHQEVVKGTNYNINAPSSTITNDQSSLIGSTSFLVDMIKDGKGRNPTSASDYSSQFAKKKDGPVLLGFNHRPTHFSQYPNSCISPPPPPPTITTLNNNDNSLFSFLNCGGGGKEKMVIGNMRSQLGRMDDHHRRSEVAGTLWGLPPMGSSSQREEGKDGAIIDSNGDVRLIDFLGVGIS